MHPHQNPWAVIHQLERVTIEVHFLDQGVTRIRATGWSAGKRQPLWHHEDVLAQDQGLMAPQDHLRHLVDVIGHDRPRNAAQMAAGLAGGPLYEAPALF